MLIDMKVWLSGFVSRALFDVSYAEYFVVGGGLFSLLLVFLPQPFLQRVLRD
ncbi:MAG: hypothetical protein ACTH3D_01410 [Halomonas sp.]|uniref:hypothetical protein n=1 Tax=Halomonas sp. TaxID=1486246 RepID=UPI003F939B70